MDYKDYLKQMEEENKVKNCCPICGYEFDEVQDVNVCPRRHAIQQEFTRDQLIGPWDDYLYCI